MGRPSWRETWRVLVYTLLIALAFVALGRLQLALIDGLASNGLLGGAGLTDSAVDAVLLRQSAQVEADSRTATQRLPEGHRLAAFRMGYELGFTSQLVGSVSRSSEPVQQTVRGMAEGHVNIARDMARALGVQPEQPLATRSLRDFAELTARIEDDQNGSAARIERQLSVLHRHLYLLGSHLGTEAARIETSAGAISLPPARQISRHATLAGVDAALWQPLARMPGQETPEQSLARYRTGLNALRAALAQPG